MGTERTNRSRGAKSPVFFRDEKIHELLRKELKGRLLVLTHSDSTSWRKLTEAEVRSQLYEIRGERVLAHAQDNAPSRLVEKDLELGPCRALMNHERRLSLEELQEGCLSLARGDAELMALRLPRDEEERTGYSWREVKHALGAAGLRVKENCGSKQTHRLTLRKRP